MRVTKQVTEIYYMKMEQPGENRDISDCESDYPTS